MSLASKILVGLNILVSLFLIWEAMQVAAARTAWIQRIDESTRWRDGQLEIFNEALAKDDVLKKMDAQKREDIKRMYASAHARRKAAAGTSFDGFKTDVKRLIADSDDAKNIIKEYGPEYYRLLLRDQMVDQSPRLRDEEQTVAAKKATLVNIREDYKKQLALLDDQITQLKKDKDAEKTLTDQMAAENAQRRQELVRLYAELEEGLTARNAAQSREKDLQEQLDYMQKKLRRLAEKNQELAEEIRRLEAAK
jgi:hypothetical protein